VILGYNALVLLAGTVLAILTRKIPTKFSESQHIGLIVFFYLLLRLTMLLDLRIFGCGVTAWTNSMVCGNGNNR
jgi:hypothetical protein